VTSIEQRRAQWLRGVLDLCVLARLRAGEAYGYELARALDAAGFGEIKGGTLYPLLSRLERDRLVTTSWRTSDLGPDRKYYRLTVTGEETLNAAGAAGLEFAAAAHALLAEPSEAAP